jgi:signal transduction histidine kinase
MESTMEFTEEQLRSKEILIQYLEDNQTLIVDEWNKSLKVDETDLYKNRIRENGFQMYVLVKNTLIGNVSEEVYKNLAYKVANERIKANVNIGEFLYNINLGRDIVVRSILEINIPTDHQKLFFDLINLYFNTFSYYAVTCYTNLKNKEIEEKNLFISENHKDKLALLGQVSSSFVHEFRNPLTAIIGFNKLLRNEHPDLKYLDIMDYELNQLNFRITQFLHTSKAEINEETSKEINVLELFDEIQQLTYASIVDGGITIEADISPDSTILAGRNGIKQVLLNLIINSVDALKNKEQPRILKVVSRSESNENIIEISNNGPAIESEYIESIFEPFFTTKELGTGIGLYVCRKIVERNNGYMKCQSNEDLTTFSIHFPI